MDGWSGLVLGALNLHRMQKPYLAHRQTLCIYFRIIIVM